MAKMRINVDYQKQVLELQKKGVGIKQIAQSLRFSRNSVRKILRCSNDAPGTPGMPAWASTIDWQNALHAAGRGVPLNVPDEENVNPDEAPYLRFWRYFRILKPNDEVVSMVLHHKLGEKIFLFLRWQGSVWLRRQKSSRGLFTFLTERPSTNFVEPYLPLLKSKKIKISMS